MLVLNEENYNLAFSCFWETPIEEHRAKFVPKTAQCSEIGQSCRHLWYASCARSKICTFRAVSAKLYRPFFVRIGKKLITSRQTNH